MVIASWGRATFGETVAQSLDSPASITNIHTYMYCTARCAGMSYNLHSTSCVVRAAMGSKARRGNKRRPHNAANAEGTADAHQNRSAILAAELRHITPQHHQVSQWPQLSRTPAGQQQRNLNRADRTAPTTYARHAASLGQGLPVHVPVANSGAPTAHATHTLSKLPSAYTVYDTCMKTSRRDRVLH